ncbi:MAG: hypothetical protein LW690_02220 [Opitutaceae bacterium]|nr:hypothetical protein [Opitutaceae bacterium]
MQLSHGLHLAYCTNVHRGETWTETFAALERHTLPVRRRVAPGRSYAIGLRLGRRAADELSRPAELAAFRAWLQRHDCYVFTINGFPYGSFHGTRVKEPASFKAFVAAEPARRARIFARLTECARGIAELAARTGRDLHLGLEPEPCCEIETTAETVAFFEAWRAAEPAVDREGLLRHVGVNYDCCHLAVEFESAAPALDCLTRAGLRLSKLHLSSALRVTPDAAGRAALAPFAEPVYLHQVIAGDPVTGKVRRRFIDLPDALAEQGPPPAGEEWRVHFHVPLHAAPGEPFRDTRDHLEGALDWLAERPGSCSHLEMETYTWEILPPALRLPVEDQLVREYAWTLDALARRGLASRELAQAAARA